MPIKTDDEVREAFEKENNKGTFMTRHGHPNGDKILAFITAQRTADLKWMEEVVIGEDETIEAKGCDCNDRCDCSAERHACNALRDSQRALLLELLA